MVNGYCMVVGEFALTDSKGNILRQATSTGYSKINSMNNENQKEILYENAVNHARSKFLYAIHKPSDTETNWYILEYQFVRVSKLDGEYIKPVKSKAKLSKKARNRAEDRVNITVKEHREDKDKMITEKSRKTMYAEQPIKKLNTKQKKELEDYKNYLLYEQMKKDKKYLAYKKSHKK